VTDLQNDKSLLVGWIVGGALVLCGLGLVVFAGRPLVWVLFSPLRLSDWGGVPLIPQFLFGMAIVVLGVAIALRHPWTRRLGWLSLVLVALLFPDGLRAVPFALYGWFGVEASYMRAQFVVPIILIALLLLGAAVLYRHPPPDPFAGRRLVPPRITVLSRTVAVLLMISGLERLTLSSAFPGGFFERWHYLRFGPYSDPAAPLELFNQFAWNGALGAMTVVAGFGIGLRRPWGIALGLAVCFAGMLIDIMALSSREITFGPLSSDWIVLRRVAAALYGVGFLYCLVELLRTPKPVPQDSQVMHSAPAAIPEIADDENWRQSLLASLRAGGVQPTQRNLFYDFVLPALAIVSIVGGWSLLNVIMRHKPPSSVLAEVVLIEAGLAAIAILLLMSLFSFCLRRLWRSGALRAEQELKRDGGRRPVLYLRAFALDEVVAQPSAAELLFGTVPGASAEQLLAKSLRRTKGPVIAIGMPGEKLPGVGAARFYASHQVWHQKVADAAHVAQLVVWTTGTTEGLRWEINHLLKSVAPEKLIVWTHPYLLRLNETEREQEWSAFIEAFGGVFPLPLPARLGRTRFIWFKQDWEPVRAEPRSGLWSWFRHAQTDALKDMLRQKDGLARA